MCTVTGGVDVPTTYTNAAFCSDGDTGTDPDLDNIGIANSQYSNLEESLAELHHQHQQLYQQHNLDNV